MYLIKAGATALFMVRLFFFISKRLHRAEKKLENSPAGTVSVPASYRLLSCTASTIAKILLLIALSVLLSFMCPLHMADHPAPVTKKFTTMPDKEPTASRIDIFNADVIRISGCSESTATRRIKECRDALGKKDHQQLTIREYCCYYGYDYMEILKLLQLI